MSGKKVGKTTATAKKVGKAPSIIGAGISSPKMSVGKAPHPSVAVKTVILPKDRAPSLMNKTLSIDVPDCIMMYADSLIDPFNTHAGVCIPSELFPIPSSKAKLYRRGRFALGTSGFGYIKITPNSSNDVSAIVHTESGSVGTNATLVSAFAPVTTAFFNQAPYQSPAFAAPGVISRIAAIGVRVKYIGKLMDRNGMVVGFEDPDHSSINGLTYDTCLASPYSMPKRVGDDDWDMSVCYSGPVNPTDVDFVPGTSQPLGANPFIIIMASGIPSDQYEYEVVEHVEYAGTVVVNKSPSHAEPGMFAKVVETAKSLTIDKPLQPEQAPSFWSGLGDAITSTIPKIIDVGKSAIGGFKAGGIFGGLFGGLTKALSMAPGMNSHRRMIDGDLLGSIKPITYGENPGGRTVKSHELKHISKAIGNQQKLIQNKDPKYTIVNTGGNSY